MTPFRLAVTGVLTFALTATAQLNLTPEAIAARDAIKPAAIEAHVRFLADDLLEGRETGTRGYELAARYVAAQFALAGLQPAGGDGTYLQRIPFRRAKLASGSFSVDGKPLADHKDYLLRPSFLRAKDSISAPLVFAGFGVVAPELKHDDYAGLDVKGKLVVTISGAPAAFPHDQRAYYSSGEVKSQAAASRGAVGMITISSNTDEARYPFAKRAAQSGMTAMRYLDNDGVPAETVPQFHASATVSRSGALALFRGAPQSLDAALAAAEKGNVRPFPLKTKATIRTTSTFESASSENVVAMLPGTSSEAVVISAHLDHLGNHATGADRIYNGAQDNASGTAAMLEIARAFAAMPSKPKRSLVFVALTGEEKGEQGSAYFAAHPPVPGPIVADINMDMFLMLFPIRDVVPLGGEHSTLGPLAAAAAQSAGLTTSADPIPEEVRFIRSDQYSFVKAGVPAIHIKAGSQSADPKIDGDKLTKEWLRTIYHTPKDDLSQPLDYTTGAKVAQTNFVLAWSVANGERPEWKKGDFFGERFGRTE
jgi:Zn-dependent M28 family amino/carboxypeptidase